jgi:hypothetical protein
MNKLVIAGATVVGVALVAKRLAPRFAESGRRTRRPRGSKLLAVFGDIDFGKAIAAMPDTAPPKWVFTNITTIRENTERILEGGRWFNPSTAHLEDALSD